MKSLKSPDGHLTWENAQKRLSDPVKSESLFAVQQARLRETKGIEGYCLFLQTTAMAATNAMTRVAMTVRIQ